MLRLFVNTLTSDEKYSCRNMQNLLQQFQTSLSKKDKTFSQFLIEFPNFPRNVEHFEKKDEYHSLITSEIIESERGRYLNV